MKSARKKVAGKKKGKGFDVKLKIYDEAELFTINVSAGDGLADLKYVILACLDEHDRKLAEVDGSIKGAPDDETEEAREERAAGLCVVLEGITLSDENQTVVELGLSKDCLVQLIQPPPQNGRGGFNFPCGATYSGEWAISGQRKLRHGVGVLKNGGEEYDGEWHKDRVHGFGKYTFASGSSYEGNFEDYKFEGQGTFRWTNNASYAGEWHNNRMHGTGVFTHENGDQFSGQFENNQFLNNHGHWIPVPEKYSFLPRDVRAVPDDSRRASTQAQEDDV